MKFITIDSQAVLKRRTDWLTISHCRNGLATNLKRRLDWLFAYASIRLT